MKLGGVKKQLPEEVDFWDKMKSSEKSSNIKEKTPPPLVPSGLFGGEQEKGDGWGDWENEGHKHEDMQG